MKTADRMIRRHSLQALLRTPWKTGLLGLLILLLTTVLGVCALLLNSCRVLLDRRDTDYVTTALLLAEEGQLTEEQRAEAWAALDPKALLERCGGLAGQRSARLALWPQGYRRILKASDFDLSVLTLKIVEEDPELLCWRGTVQDVLYSSVATEALTVKLDLWAKVVDGSSLGLTPENAAEQGYVAITQTIPQASFVFGSGDVEEDEIVYYAEGPLPQVGHTYLVVTSARARGEEGVGFPVHMLSGSDTLPPALLDITETGLDETDPAQLPYFQFAAQWERVSNQVVGSLAEDPSYLEEFTQGDLALTQGSLYAPGAAGCCLLPEKLAGALGVGPGDTVCFECLPIGGYDAAADGPLPCRSYLVMGLIALTAQAEEQQEARVYLSDAEGFAENAVPDGRTLATLRLKNGVTREELSALEAALPEGVTVTVFDQGWAGVTRALTTLEQRTLRLFAAAALAALGLLLLFGYLFAGKQRETLGIMGDLGVSKALCRRYVAVGAGLLLAVSALAGCVTAAGLSGVLNRVVSRLLSDPARSYSNLSMGIVKVPDRAVLLSWQVLLGCWALVTGAGLGVCLGFSYRGDRRRASNARPYKKKTTATGRGVEGAAPCGRLLQSLGPVRRYRLLSVLRRPGRSLAVVGVSLLLPLFLMGIGREISLQKQALETLATETEIDGYLTDYSGKDRYGLVLPKADLEVLGRMKEIGQLSYAYADRAETPGLKKEASSLVYTNDLRCWLEFDRAEEYEIQWLDGWNEAALAANRDYAEGKKPLESFSSGTDAYYYAEDPRALWVLAPEAFLKANGLALGDRIQIRTRDPETEWYRENQGEGESYLIAGVLYSSRSGGDILYTCLENAARYRVTAVEMNGELVGYRELLVPNRYHACRFELQDAARLQDAKEELRRAGVSQVRGASRYRIYPVFDDKTYLQEAEKLENSLASFRWLLWIALGLSLGAGLALAWLLLGRRTTEMGVLRSVGAGRFQIFRMLWTEQAILCLGGTGAALLLWRCFAPWGWEAGLAGVFAGAYLLGAGAAVIVCLRIHILTVLSEKEG